MRKFKCILVAFYLAGLFGAGSGRCFGMLGERGPKVGDAPPALKLSLILGGPHVTEVSWNTLKGKVVVLEFWGTRCGPCLQAIPHWNELVDQFRDRPVAFLAISEENGEVVKEFLKWRAMKGWVAADGALAATTTAFDVEGIPTTVVVSPTGKISAITHPALLEAKHLEEVLAGRPSTIEIPKRREKQEALEIVPRASIVPTIVGVSIAGPFPMPNGAYNSRGWKPAGYEFEAKKAYLRDALAAFFRVGPKLVIERAKLPDELYDISVVGRPGRESQLSAQFVQAVQTAFDISVQLRNQEVEVYSMTIAATNAPALKETTLRAGGGEKRGGFAMKGVGMDIIADYLGNAVGRPVVDDTRATNRWAADLRWELSAAERLLARLDAGVIEKLSSSSAFLGGGELPHDLRGTVDGADLAIIRSELAKPSGEQFRPDPEKVIKAAREQLGLELRPVRRSMRVVEIGPAAE